MRKLSRLRFLSSNKRSSTKSLLVPHILYPSVKIVHDSSNLVFPKYTTENWTPFFDPSFFQTGEIALENEECKKVNQMFIEAYSQIKLGHKEAFDKQLTEIQEHNVQVLEELGKESEKLVEGWKKGPMGPMAYIGAGISLNNVILPLKIAILTSTLNSLMMNKDLKNYSEHKPKIIETIKSLYATYLAASDHYEDELYPKLIMCLADMLNFESTFMQSSKDDLIATAVEINNSFGLLEISGPKTFWATTALNFNLVLLHYQLCEKDNIDRVLTKLESDLFSLELSSTTTISKENKQLLQGCYVYNKCQLANVGYTKKQDLLEYAHDLLNDALGEKNTISMTLFDQTANGNVGGAKI